MLEFFQELKWKTRNLSAEKIINMDETPCYFVMTRNDTLSFKEPKNVDSILTGGRKKRFTVCLVVSLDGRGHDHFSRPGEGPYIEAAV